jgi:hypothetical protein
MVPEFCAASAWSRIERLYSAVKLRRRLNNDVAPAAGHLHPHMTDHLIGGWHTLQNL